MKPGFVAVLIGWSVVSGWAALAQPVIEPPSARVSDAEQERAERAANRWADLMAVAPGVHVVARIEGVTYPEERPLAAGSSYEDVVAEMKRNYASSAIDVEAWTEMFNAGRAPGGQQRTIVVPRIDVVYVESWMEGPSLRTVMRLSDGTVRSAKSFAEAECREWVLEGEEPITAVYSGDPGANGGSAEEIWYDEACHGGIHTLSWLGRPERRQTHPQHVASVVEEGAAEVADVLLGT